MEAAPERIPMLRARPTRYTSALPELRRLLTDLGLVATEEGHGWVVLDAGSGRVRLRAVSAGSRGDGLTAFAVEIRDPEVFARRTVQDGGRASVEDTISGRRVRITGPDGFSFLAEPTGHEALCGDADPALTVRMEWLTPDVPGAAATLAAIGARPLAQEPGGAPAVFAAKNGGILAARAAGVLRAGELVFEYDGDLATLAARLAGGGWSPSADGAPDEQGGGVGRVTIPVPDGSPVTILTPARAIR